MGIPEVMDASPYLSALVTLALGTLFLILLETFVKLVFFSLPNRVLRHLNIRRHGWPPAHCDADGDFKEEEKL